MGTKAETEAPKEPQQPEAGATPAEESALPDIDRATLHRLLEKFGDDPDFRKEARSQRWIGGIAGEVAQQQRLQEQHEAAAKAVEAERVRLKELRTLDPLKFAEEIGERMDVEEERREKAGLREMTRREFASKIGAALQDLPEFKELTADDIKQIGTALQGVSDDDVVAVYTREAANCIAEKRAQKLYETRHKTEVAEERKAWGREQATKKVQERRSPSLREPSQGNAQDQGEPDFRANPAEWIAWDNANQKNRRGVYAAL